MLNHTDPNPTNGTRMVVVHERNHITLRCPATGIPRPKITWLKTENNYLVPLKTGVWSGKQTVLFYNF